MIITMCCVLCVSKACLLEMKPCSGVDKLGDFGLRKESKA
jgi:hypothetical protein